MKPDAFERMVEQAVLREGGPLHRGLSQCRVVQLLRRHHARIRRKVVKYIRERGHEYMRDSKKPGLTWDEKMDYSGRAWAIKDLADDILALLDRLEGK